jgi:hypothetical protein
MDSGQGEGELKKMMGFGEKMCPWGWIMHGERMWPIEKISWRDVSLGMDKGQGEDVA